MCDVNPLLVDSHIVGVGKPIFGRNRDPTVVLASGHFYNWLEVAANYNTSQIAITSMKNQSYCKCVCVCMYILMYACIYKYENMNCTLENLDNIVSCVEVITHCVITITYYPVKPCLLPFLSLNTTV